MKDEPQPISHRLVFCHAAVAFLVTSAVAWITPLSFSGYLADQSLSRFWLILSDSGAQWGVGSAMLLATALVAAKHAGIKTRTLKAVQFFAGLCIVLATLALINEFVSKPLIAAHRPFVLKLDEAGLLSADELYAMNGKPDRTDFLRKILDENPDHPLVRFLDPHIKEHWALHTGFSFPSGHSQNAFLFAVILGFLIQHLLPNGKRFVWIPFLWAGSICLSRVALGVHSPLDITVGALTGGILGSLILMSGLLNKILPMKTLED
jgi:phosphatidylglycerophosphatase B